mgnify:CR=1 FL=1
MKKEDVQFRSDSLVLRGEIYLPEQTIAPGILVCHAMHAQGFRWLPLYRMLAERATERGFACLLFDFRGCGMSDGQFDYGWSEQRDAQAAFEFLLSREHVDSRGAFVIGRSLGGTIALHSLIDDPRAKGFALWATPPDHYQNIKNFVVKRRGGLGYFMFLLLSFIDRLHNVTRGMRLDVFGLRLRLKDLRGKLMALKNSQLLSARGHPPVLLVVGEKDEYVSLQEARIFEKFISTGRGLIVLAETGHTFKGAEENLISITLDWFRGLTKILSTRGSNQLPHTMP